MSARLRPALVLALAAQRAAGGGGNRDAGADVVYLRDGRRLEGAITEEGGQLVIKMRLGTVTVDKGDVLKIEKGRTPEEEYKERHAALGPRDAAGRMALAAWCKERGLSAEAKKLWEEVVRIDPDHAGARGALGHVRRGDRWLTEEEAMKEAGFVRHQGRWVLPEEKELLERKEYLAGAKLAGAAVADERSGRIRLEHPRLGPRDVPARVAALTGDQVRLEGELWPVAAEVPLAGLPVMTAYKIRLRFGPAGQGAFRLELARWLAAKGEQAAAASEAALAARLDPALAREAKEITEAGKPDPRAESLAFAQALWERGEADRAIALLSRQLEGATAAAGAELKRLLGEWKAAGAERDKTLARLLAAERLLDPQEDARALGFVRGLRSRLPPALARRVAALLEKRPETPGSRPAAGEELAELERALVYGESPVLKKLATARLAALEAWLLRHKDTWEDKARAELRKSFFSLFPEVDLVQVAAVLAHGRRYAAEVPLGVSEHEYVVRADGSKTSFHLYLPRGYTPYQRWPLLVYLHGKGGSGGASVALWTRLAEREGWVIVCPTAAKNRERGWGATEGERSAALSGVAEAVEKVAADPERIYLAGTSMGGHGAWDVALHHPDRFAAVLAMLGSPRLHHMRFLPNLLYTAVWAGQGALDDELLVAGVRYATTRLDGLGYTVRYREEPALGHEPLPGAEEQFAAWIKDRRRPAAPRKVVLRTAGEPYTRAWWVEITGYDERALSSATKLVIPGYSRMSPVDQRRAALAAYELRVADVTAQASEGNKIELVAGPLVRSVRVHLAPDLVALERPLAITLNGKPAWSGRAAPSLDLMLEEARKRRDRDGATWAAVDVRTGR